jgi:hypothetical protein
MIIDLLKSLPEAWQEFRANSGSAVYENALALLVAAGMVEQRRNMRLRIPGYSKVVFLQFRGSGKDALRKVLEMIKPTLTEWAVAVGKTSEGVFFETNPVFQMRLTDQGCQAKQDIEQGQIKRVLDFVHKSGFFQFRDDFPSVAHIESLDIKDTAVQPAGAVAVAQASASIGEVKIENKITVDNSSLVQKLANTLKKVVAAKTQPAKKPRKKPAHKPKIDPKRIPLKQAEIRLNLLKAWEEQQEKSLTLPKNKRMSKEDFAKRMRTSEEELCAAQAWYRKNRKAHGWPEDARTMQLRELRTWFA